MSRTVEVKIDAIGQIHPLGPSAPLPEGRALLTWPVPAAEENMHLSEKSLSEDWLNPEEDAAWAHLQQAK